MVRGDEWIVPGPVANSMGPSVMGALVAGSYSPVDASGYGSATTTYNQATSSSSVSKYFPVTIINQGAHMSGSDWVRIQREAEKLDAIR